MRRKYGNKSVIHDGIKFASTVEGDYYLYLKQLQEEGIISNLRMQVPYEIIPAVWGTRTVQLKTKSKEVKYSIQKATHYLADFVYIDTATGKEHVIDVKGRTAPLTQEFKLKRKLMQYVNGITIEIVRL
jgi:hypothetical protein